MVNLVESAMRAKAHVTTWLLLSKWAENEREKRARAKLPRVSAKEKHIARLEKQLAKIRVTPPVHPFTPSTYGDTAQHIRERDTRELDAWHNIVMEGSACERPLTIGQQWALWKREAPKRREIMRLARRGDSCPNLYKELRTRGYTVKTWSDLTKWERDSMRPPGAGRHWEASVHDYLARLWEFCGLTTRRHVQFDYYLKPEAPDTLGAKHYENWLERLHERKQIVSQIEAIRALPEPKKRFVENKGLSANIGGQVTNSGAEGIENYAAPNRVTSHGIPYL